IKAVGAIFGGVSLTSLTYFILINGLSGLAFIPESFKTYLAENVLVVLLVLFLFWSAISQIIMSLFKKDILKAIILIGTFALALARSEERRVGKEGGRWW